MVFLIGNADAGASGPSSSPIPHVVQLKILRLVGSCRRTKEALRIENLSVVYLTNAVFEFLHALLHFAFNRLHLRFNLSGPLIDFGCQFRDASFGRRAAFLRVCGNCIHFLKNLRVLFFENFDKFLKSQVAVLLLLLSEALSLFQALKSLDEV